MTQCRIAVFPEKCAVASFGDITMLHTYCYPLLLCSWLLLHEHTVLQVHAVAKPLDITGLTGTSPVPHPCHTQ
jgi:hypothetical protein